ncbi:unnamed protein product [Protopolystoma xenopodis]|uniref:Caspase family p10 domain-containing protein n=1 Tax=Protopolystoma xenopodis TaxID=117903 RepID=A0A448X262_9PLAT|nr:unnamed protein product [Protopolystoma xenopodis]
MSKPDDHIDGPANQSDPSSWIALPYMSDCVIAYSTLPGFVSWRSETGGSWYVQVFVEVLKDLGSQLHFIDLLCEVNRRMVEEGATAGYKQISQPVTTLTRPFFLTASHK